MRFLRHVGCTIAIYALAAASGHAQESLPAGKAAQGDFYISGSAGLYFRESTGGPAEFTNGLASAPGTESFSFDPGGVFNAAFGYRLPAHFRVEIEAGYSTYERASVRPASASFPALNGSDFKRASGGRVENFSGTANIFYDIPCSEVLTPYLGLGMGADHRKGERGSYVSASGTVVRVEGESRTHGVALGEAGVAVAIDSRLSLVPAYRYLRFFTNDAGRAEEAAHIVKIGLRYAF